MLIINDPVQKRDTSKPDIEGSLEVKLPTIWTHGKAEVGKV
jgi:hypothetical protein